MIGKLVVSHNQMKAGIITDILHDGANPDDEIKLPLVMVKWLEDYPEDCFDQGCYLGLDVTLAAE